MKALVCAAPCCKPLSEGQVKVAPSVNGIVIIDTGWTKRLAAGALPRKLALVTDPLATAPTLTGLVDERPLLAMMPATCVPWPLRSIRPRMDLLNTRGFKSGCVASTPESLTLTSTLL